jgi:putative tryptophan/tyrosine transport system substrate-binding protein
VPLQALTVENWYPPPIFSISTRGLEMRRREFLTLLGGTAVAWPLVTRAQQPLKVHHIAMVHASAPVGEMSETGNPGYRALFQELRRLGYVEGRNLVVERYSAEGGGQKRYAELAPNVVDTKPDLIFATSNPLVLSFKALTDTIPIVGFMADPIRSGIAASLARPGAISQA